MFQIGIKRVRRRLTLLLRRYPHFSRLLADGLQMAGFQQLGTKLKFGARVPDEVFEIVLPNMSASSSTDGRKVSMKSMQGNDLIVRIFATQGWRAFEFPLPDFMLYFAGCSSVFLDIGANTGFYSLLAAVANPKIKSYAFEPLPFVIQILKENINLNYKEDQIVIIPKAVSSVSGKAAFYIPKSSDGLVETSASLSEKFKDSHEEILEVEVTSLDDCVATSGFERVDLIKIDVEGLEDQVLQGAMNLIQKHRPILFYEVLDRANFKLLNEIKRRCDYLSFRMGQRGIVQEEEIAFHGDSWNHIMIPMGKLNLLKDCCMKLNLPLHLLKVGPAGAGNDSIFLE